MSKKRVMKKITVRIPNPDAPVKERLRTPPHKRHASKKDYRRRGKHPAPPDPSE